MLAQKPLTTDKCTYLLFRNEITMYSTMMIFLARVILHGFRPSALVQLPLLLEMVQTIISYKVLHLEAWSREKHQTLAQKLCWNTCTGPG